MNTMPVIFDFETRPIRTFDIEGEVWFVAADVCTVLGISNHRDAISRLDDEERGSTNTDSLGGPQETSTINESGLYSLILTSRKPEAKRFKKWVTAEVLPAIRKTGRYEAGAPAMPSSVSHRADHVVAATRTFSGFMRVASSLKLPHAVAARRANEAALRYTGVDIIGELDAEAFLGSARQSASLGADPYMANAFLKEWIAGYLPVPVTACRSRDLYAAYQLWCRMSGHQPAPVNAFNDRLLDAHGIRKKMGRTDEGGREISVNIVYPPQCETPEHGEIIRWVKAESACFYAALLAWQEAEDPPG